MPTWHDVAHPHIDQDDEGALHPHNRHDISFDRDGTLLRTITSQGSGVTVCEGSECTVHIQVHVPAEVTANSALLT